jgi:hypothetical protein
MKSLFSVVGLFLFSLCITAGCNSQAIVSPHQGAALSWTQATSCTAAIPCPTYLIGRVSVTSSTTTCPTTTGTSYTVIATLNTSNATSFTDSTITASGFYCYEVQAEQGSPLLTGAASGASNGGVAVTITEPPTAPGAPSASEQVASNQVEKTLSPSVENRKVLMASNNTDMVLTVKIVNK